MINPAVDILLVFHTYRYQIHTCGSYCFILWQYCALVELLNVYLQLHYSLFKKFVIVISRYSFVESRSSVFLELDIPQHLCDRLLVFLSIVNPLDALIWIIDNSEWRFLRSCQTLQLCHLWNTSKTSAVYDLIVYDFIINKTRHLVISDLFRISKYDIDFYHRLFINKNITRCTRQSNIF